MAKAPFTPPRLPPELDYTKLVGAIGKAHASIARLEGLLFNLRNPQLLSRAFITKEAVLSSQIEGTQATISEVLEQDAKGIDRDVTRKERDYREIVNYRRALERGIELLKERPLTENLIKELHRILLRSARGESKRPGEFRDHEVYIGRQGLGKEHASYIPPLPPAIPELFSDLERYMHSGGERDTLVQIAIIHYQFEAIHPFADGNGRIGRLLISLMLYQKGLLTHPFIYLSEFFEEHRQDYYDLLRNVSEKGDWESWVLFFLRGIDEQARKAQETAKRILDLHEALRGKVAAFGSSYAHEFLDALFMQPLFMSGTIRALVHLKSPTTLFMLISKFEKAGIITDVAKGQRRNKIYRFDALNDILKR